MVRKYARFRLYPFYIARKDVAFKLFREVSVALLIASVLLLEEIGRDANDVVDDVVNGVTETGDTLMDGVDDVVDGGENGTDGTGNVDNNAVE